MCRYLILLYFDYVDTRKIYRTIILSANSDLFVIEPLIGLGRSSVHQRVNSQYYTMNITLNRFILLNWSDH